VEKEPILIGLTGGIASGKSTVIQYLRYQGYPVIDADKLGHKVLEPGNQGYKKVVDKFGEGILNKDKTVNRLILGGIVFSDPYKLQVLNEISHPIIAEMVMKEFKSISSMDQTGIVFLEAALLIEANWYNMCQHIWLVTLEKAEASRRLQKRDGLSESEAISRLESQLTAKEKIAYADVVLRNDGSRKDLLSQTQHALEDLRQN
tara:strand:- start:8623 stop:9234 length:612 start_codon:yes stop_codon:yes gene_type:complete